MHSKLGNKVAHLFLSLFGESRVCTCAQSKTFYFLDENNEPRQAIILGIVCLQYLLALLVGLLYVDGHLTKRKNKYNSKLLPPFHKVKIVAGGIYLTILK